MEDIQVHPESTYVVDLCALLHVSPTALHISGFGY